MNCEIVSIGTELLMGQIVNSDAQYLSQRLQGLGISVYYHTTVGDNPERMRDAIARALSRSDIVITTGGLGPTQDDLSKEIAAELLGLPMRFDEASWAQIRAYFEKLGRDCPEINRKQAMLAEGAEALPNACGTAPGCYLELGGRTLVQLPGPPREMKDMFERQVAPRLAARMDGCIASRYIRIYGLGESAVAQMCAKWIEGAGEATVAPYCQLGECQLRVTAKAATEPEALGKVEPVVGELLAVLGGAVYAVCPTSEGSMEAAAAQALLSRRLTVATAESCTGGLVAARLISCPGISAALCEAHVTYANEAKIRYCGVDPETLARFGAVSEQTAREMALGLRERSGADIAVSTTGIAGPDGGTAKKPVGLVYIGVASAKGVAVEERRFSGDRERVRSLAALAALNGIRRAAIEA
ncbi:MAG: competence/damage-inducible protein A [Clostridia bacterium]|nr:competence/damage-inducible protein A [Clostridia bacterium]